MMFKKSQLICSLDSSLLEENYRTEKIALDKAQADWVNGEQNYRIVVSQNESDIEKAKTDIALAEIDLEKYIGMPKGTLGRLKREEARALLLEMEKSLVSFLEKHHREFPEDEGEYQKILADWNGQIQLADAGDEMWKDRVAYSQRMQRK